MGSPKSHGHAEALGGAHGNVGAEGGGGLDLGEGHEVSGGNEQSSSLVEAVSEGLVSLPGGLNGSVGVGVLDDGSAVVSSGEVSGGVVPTDELDADGAGASLE